MIWIVVYIALVLPPVIVLSIVWTNLLDRTTKSAEWRQHKDDPGYWE